MSRAVEPIDYLKSLLKMTSNLHENSGTIFCGPVNFHRPRLREVVKKVKFEP